MINIFKKTDDLKDCYLIASNVFEKKVLDEDKLELYNELLLDSEIPDSLKFLIKNFLLPYKISILKWTLNKEYYEDPYPVDFRNDHKQIAPSLKIIKQDPVGTWTEGYPSWFYIVFPDVLLWAIKGEGNRLIKKKFEYYSEEQFIEGNRIRPDVLNEIIQMYLKNTGKPLECKKY